MTGIAFVHVSVQRAGLCCTPLTPKIWDPVRYAGLDHPGDAWADDIFSQIAQAFRSPAGDRSLDPMGGLGAAAVEHVLAAGQSQSALRLRSHLASWLPSHPASVGLIDGFLVHGDVLASKPFSKPLPGKVINLLSDFEAYDDGFDPAQDSDPHYRLWEVAGTGHSDYFIGHQSVAGHGPRVMFNAAKQTPAQHEPPCWRPATTASGSSPSWPCARWPVSPCRCGTWCPAPSTSFAAGWTGGRRRITGRGSSSRPARWPRTSTATRVGGIRLPPIEVPVARYESTSCGLGGITIPFTDTQLAEQYGTHATYYEQMAAATDEAVAGGWVLPADAIDQMERACAARIRFPDADRTCPTYSPPAYDEPLSRPAAPPSPPRPPTSAGPSSPSTPTGVGTLPATGTAVPVALALATVAVALALRPRRPERGR